MNNHQVKKSPVVMVGIDGADWKIVKRLVADGRLPALASLMGNGCHGELASPADAYAGGVWPDFYTGKPVSEHGIYHNKLWHQAHMRVEVPTDRWLSSRPFYEALSERGFRVCVLDVPMVLGSPTPLNGLYLGGWGTHDLISKGSWPASLWPSLTSRFGKPKMPVEQFGPQTPEGLLKLRQQLLATTQQITAIARSLLQSEPWDFSCVVLGAAHRAGHYLWDASQVDDAASAQQRAAIQHSLEEIYIACDKSLGTLMAAAPGDAVKIVFAVHGMITNHGWSDLGADIIDALLTAGLGHRPKKGLLYQIRRRIPFQWIRPLLTRLPNAITDHLVKRWSSQMYAWTSTPYFPLPMDQAGYVRINLKGRERDGIVAPGRDYDALCERLESYFYGIQDADSGKPLVKNITRAWQETPASAAARSVLPDLLIHWGELAVGEVGSLRCDALPHFHLDVPKKTVSGRSGNHIGRGWFVAAGSAICQQALRGYTIRDLAPTVFQQLGTPLLDSFSGRPIPLKNLHDH